MDKPNFQQWMGGGLSDSFVKNGGSGCSKRSSHSGPDSRLLQHGADAMCREPRRYEQTTH